MAKAKQGPPSRTLEPHEREGLEKHKANLDKMLRAGKEFNESGVSEVLPSEVSISKEKILAEKRHIEQVLAQGTPERASNDAERNRILARRKELEAKFVPFLETWQDINVVRRDSPEYRAAFEKAQKRHLIEPYIAEWKELGKRLDPEDPSINSLDKLRSAR